MSTTIDASHRVVRHPFRGGFAGLVFGIGLAILLISFSVIALGTVVPLVVIGFWVLAGVLLGTVVPPLGRGALQAPADGAAAAPVEPAPPASAAAPVVTEPESDG